MTTDDKSIAINALIEAVTTIEKVLGIVPNGIYSDVRVRLDILESRINNPTVPVPTTNPLYKDYIFEEIMHGSYQHTYLTY